MPGTSEAVHKDMDERLGCGPLHAHGMAVRKQSLSRFEQLRYQACPNLSRFPRIRTFGRNDADQAFLQTLVPCLARWLGVAAFFYLAVPVFLWRHALL